MVTAPLSAGVGVLADRLLGEPPDAAHPVVLLGRVLTSVEGRLYADSRARGVAHASIGLAIGAAAGVVVRSPAAATYVAVAGRALGDAGSAVERALADRDLDRARALLPSLVGRDPTGLDETGISRAVVESIAENTVDAVVAPALWAAALGAPGVLAHRAVNTMDAMVGHRSDRYGRYGWAAARLDDAAAWIPARVTAGLVAACRPAAAREVLRVVQRDAAAHPSPNSGVAEAAFAAALGVRLGGANRYADRIEHRAPLGDGRPPRADDIASAVRLSRDVSVALAVLLVLAGLARRPRR